MNATSPRHRIRASTTAFVLCGLTVLTLVVFAQVRSFEFVNFDDDVHVYENTYVTGGLTAQNVAWAFGIHGPSQWHPLAWLSHQLDCQLFALWPGGHHLTNLLFHLGSVAVLFLFLARVTGCVRQSAFVAAVFAVHPLNVESVVWVSERRNVLALFFGLLTLASYASFVQHRSVRRYLLVLCCFCLALMSKPLVVTLPFVLLLLDYWPLGRLQTVTGADSRSATDDRPVVSVGWLISEKVPLLMLAAVASVLTIWCQAGVIVTTESLPLHVRILNALAAYAMYLGKIIWPANLGVFYPHPGFFVADPLSELAVPAAIGSVLLLLVTVWTVRVRRQQPWLTVGWFWFLGTLVPMIGLVQVGQQQLADRYVYLPLIGILIAVAWTIPAVATVRKVHQSWLRLAAGGIVLACTVCSWLQTGYWRDSVALYEQTLAITKRNSWVHNNLGLAHMNRGLPVNAIVHFREALEIDPDYGLARYNLGVVLHDQKRTGQAVAHFQEAVRLMPNDLKSRLRLGIAFADLGQPETAVLHFTAAVRMAPQVPDTHLNLGIALARLGRTAEAIQSYRRVLELDPQNLKAHYGLAVGLIELQQPSEAEEHFLQAIRLAPGFASAHNDYGTLLLDRGDRDAAIAQFREALRIQPDLQAARANLERALAL